jgi:integrase/recombinase XerC/integrase/recombinase XerD
VDTKSKKLLVRSGKGGNDRLAMFTSETARLIEAWLEVRRSDDNALFVAIGGNTPGAPLTPRGLRIIVKKVGERAGLTGVSPHAFRRGGAVGLTLNGAPGRVVMQAAGWSSQRMLETYTRNISDADIEAAYRRYAPLERPETAPQPTKSEP